MILLIQFTVNFTYILIFNDMTYLQIVKNQKLALSFPELKLFGDKHNFMTISVTGNFYDVPLSKTEKTSSRI